MKFLIVSDIHGARIPAEKISEIYKNNAFDKLLLLGDLLYHGPRNNLPESYEPKAVIEILSGLKDEIIAVRGNCEAEVDQMVLPFSVLSESALVFADGMRIFLTHGHIHTPEKHPGGIDAYFSGHTHIPVLKAENGTLYLNPGSVSIPKGGFPPSYAIYEDGNIRVLSLTDGSELFSYHQGIQA